METMLVITWPEGLALGIAGLIILGAYLTRWRP